MPKGKKSAKQIAVQSALKKASKQASKEGKKGKAFRSRVKTLFKQYHKSPGTKPKKLVKKTTKKKTGSNPGKSGGNTTTKKKFTQGDIMLTDAMAGPGLRHALKYLETGNERFLTVGIPKIYGGYDRDTQEFDPVQLVRGWGGTVNEVAHRKLFRATGVNPYPSKKSILEMIAYYGKDIQNMWDNQGDLAGFYEQHYRDYHGVDLAVTGFEAYQPLEMVDTLGPLWLVKQGKKFARNELGIKLPKWM